MDNSLGGRGWCRCNGGISIRNDGRSGRSGRNTRSGDGGRSGRSGLLSHLSWEVAVLCRT